MKKVRTIKEAITEIKELDPHSAITEYAIRTLVNNGEISHIRRGRKILIDFDELQNYFTCGNSYNNSASVSGGTYYNECGDVKHRTSRF